MEQEVKDSRIEHQVELTELNTKYAEAQAQNNQYVQKEILNEERLKRIQEEKERQLE